MTGLNLRSINSPVFFRSHVLSKYNCTALVCFKAEETCYHEMDRGAWYRGKVNVTSLGPCSPWSDIARIDHYKHYHHVGIDNNNYCRNTILFQFEEEPWCYAAGQKAFCGIPKCDGKRDVSSALDQQ